MGTNSAPLVADLLPFSHERDLVMALSDVSRLMLLMHLTLHPDIWTVF